MPHPAYFKSSQLMLLARWMVLFLPFCGITHLQSQPLQLFQHKENLDLVQKGANYIYNQQVDSAALVIAKVKKRLPSHPVVPMMEALRISYAVMPMKSYLPEYDPHIRFLNETIAAATLLRQVDKNHPEGVFFELAARGLIAEYYADEGNHLKALGEAKKIYGLMKVSLEMGDEFPEFYFTSGLYNYFREKFPQENAVYRPFLWIFKSGDTALGLKQLDLANEKAILASVSSHLYSAYIYLHYEMDTNKAISYLEKLQKRHPKNEFFITKLAEIYIRNGQFSPAAPLAKQLLNSKKNHYLIAGEALHGLLMERHEKSTEMATLYYNRALKTSKLTKGGVNYKAMALLGLGRIDLAKGNVEAAKHGFTEVLRIAESEPIKEEAKSYLKLL